MDGVHEQGDVETRLAAALVTETAAVVAGEIKPVIGHAARRGLGPAKRDPYQDD